MPSIDIGLTISALNNATSGLNEATSGITRLGESSQATANRLKAIQVVIAGILIQKTIEMGKAFLDATSSIQNLDSRMAAWAGGAKNAQSILQSFNKDLGASGISLEAMGNAFIRLRAAGIDQGTAFKTVENLVQGIASVGGTDLEGTLEAAASAFQRFSAKGVVSMRELNVFIKASGLTMKEVADAMGISITTFHDELQKKMLSAQALLTGFNKAAEDKFGGFVQLLGGTVGGALNRFKTTLELSLGSLGENSGLNAALAATINNVTSAMEAFIRSIKPTDVRAFFDYIRDAVPVLEDMGRAVLVAGRAALTLADILAKMIGAMPPEAAEYGMIGYFLLGKKGALIGAAVGGAIDKLKGMPSLAGNVDAGFQKTSYQGLLDANNNQNPKSPIENMFKSAGEYAGGEFFHTLKTVGDWFDGEGAGKVAKFGDTIKKTLGGMFGGNGAKGGFLSGLLPTDAQIKAIEADLAKLQAHKFGDSGMTGVPGNTAEANKAAITLETTLQSIKKISGQVQLMEFKAAGDEISAKLQEIKDTTIQWTGELDKAALAVKQSALASGEKRTLLTMIVQLEERAAKAAADSSLQAQRLYVQSQAQLAIDTQIAISKQAQAQAAATIALHNLSSPGASFVSGATGGLQDEVDKQVMEYKQKILEYQKEINTLQTDELKNPANTAQDNAQISALTKTISLTQQLATATKASTVAMSQMFHDLGNTLNNTLASGISGVIMGTMKWRDVAKSLISDLVSGLIKYLLQLVELQIFSKLALAASTAAMAPAAAAMTAMWMPAATAASIASYGSADAVGVAALQAAMATSLVPFANGGVVKGGIKPFADGGIISGPTMFGLAGEAGTEAIMPLTRIGGKLGVRAEGGGGGNHYHIHAIDTQSGLSFIAQHIDNIDAGLRRNAVMRR